MNGMHNYKNMPFSCANMYVGIYFVIMKVDVKYITATFIRKPYNIFTL